MLQQWKQVLENTGAEFANDAIVSFGHPDNERKTLPHGEVICDLSHLGVIRVQGADASDFLQNQLTNDIKQVTDTQAQLSAWCNHKGRTIATFLVHKHDDSYYLTLSADLMVFVLKRLQMYIMRSDVQLQDATEPMVHFGFAGSDIQQAWNDCCESSLSEQDYDVLVSDSLSIIKIPGVIPRYEVLGLFEDASLLWEKLIVRATPVSGETWNYLNIASGLPVVAEASREAWIPQMLNLQVIDGVSFQKGCFPGQEIVARLKYLGKNKRRLFRLKFATDVIPNVGEPVVAEIDDKSTEAGKVFNAALNPDGEVEVLAVLKIAMTEQPLFLGNTDGASANVLELPYSVEE